MLLRGRGVVFDGDQKPWFFDLEEKNGRLTGELKVEGWGPSATMGSWYEGAKGRCIEMTLQDFGRVLLTPLGVRIHESGHHNEASVSVEGSLVSA